MHFTHRVLRIRTLLTGRQLFFASALLVVGLVISPRGMVAQATATLTGRITDRQNGQPLFGARISVPGTAQGTVSRSDGTYRLTLPAGPHP
ncbi:MAG: carboxypeptidase-like regulatory domain-containing protein, partial [Gemmatimonadota bacterium]|nr:carboxypeptidase-like regulatory domain-containing protein [Gemmatimonadota bacterium]